MGGKVRPVPGVTPGPGSLYIYIEFGHRKLDCAPHLRQFTGQAARRLHRTLNTHATSAVCTAGPNLQAIPAPPEQRAVSWQLVYLIGLKLHFNGVLRLRSR